MREFLNMGGYGAYVWSAYGIALLVLLYNLLAPAISGRRQRRRLRKRLHIGVPEL